MTTCASPPTCIVTTYIGIIEFLLDELERLWILKSRLTPGIIALDTE
jgi:hypothetical protein